EMIRATLDGVNPHFVNPLVLSFIERIRRFLIPTFWIAAVTQLAILLLGWRNFKRAENRWRIGVTMIVAATAGGALVVHYIAFKAIGLVMPTNRTAVFFAPLVTVMVGAAVSIPLGSRTTQWVRRAAITMLCVMASYFILCLRIGYFHEWDYISEARDAYF